MMAPRMSTKSGFLLLPGPILFVSWRLKEHLTRIRWTQRELLNMVGLHSSPRKESHRSRNHYYKIWNPLWFMLLAVRRPKWLYIPGKFEEHLDARFALSFASSHSYAYIVLLKPSQLCPYLDIQTLSMIQLDQCQYLDNCAPTLPLTQH